jgi:predicted kinase
MNIHQPNNGHSLLIIVRGMPGSGKSYLAAELQRSLGDVVMLDPDMTDYNSRAYAEHTQAQVAEGVDPKLHAYRFLRAQAYDAIRDGKTIIWNQPFTDEVAFRKMVDRLKAHAAASGVQLSILVVEVEIDPTVAKTRVSQRKQNGGHGPSDATLAARINAYHSFAGEGYNTLTVQGDDDVAVSVASTLRALQHL